MASLFYFEHHLNSRNDVKIIQLDEAIGQHIGYSLYFQTLEVMLEMDGFRISSTQVCAVARMLFTSVAKYQNFLTVSVDLGLFAFADSFYFSPRFLEWAEKKDQIRQQNSAKGKLGGRPRKDLVTNQVTGQDHIAEPSKLIETKLSPKSEESVTKLNPNDNLVLQETDGNEKPVLPEKSLGIKDVFDHWNSKQIKVHREISETLKNALKKALKKYTAEQICGAIDAYAKRLADPADFWEYRWTLLDFLTRKNALPVFAELSQNTEQVKVQKAQEAGKSQSCEVQKRLDESALVSELSSRLWADFGDLRELLSHLWKFPTPESKMSYIQTMPERLQQIVQAPASRPITVMKNGTSANLEQEYKEIKK